MRTSTPPSTASSSASAAPSSASTSSLPFNTDLREDWAKGKITSEQVQRYALGALRQGAEGLDPFARAGASGQHPQNIFRALKHVFGMPRGAPDMDWIELPMVVGDRVVQVAHPFLLPHRFFAAFHDARADAFATAISGPDGACRQFWDSISTSAFVTSHPNLPRSSWSRIVPLGVHADAGAFSHHDSIYTISWNSLMGEGTTIRKRFLFTVLRKSGMHETTLEAALSIMAWSMNALLTGKEPTTDWLGRQVVGGGGDLASGWKAALCQVRGDWAFYKECFQFPQWNEAIRMCWKCRASSTLPDLLYTDCSPTAGWRATHLTNTDYRRQLRREHLAVPALLGRVIGMRLECIMVDVLHTVDQGVASHVIANIFWIVVIIRGAFGGANIPDKIARLNNAVKKWYSDNRITSKLQGKLTEGRLRPDGKYPKLKAKAACTRHLAAFALHLITLYHDGSTDDDLAKAVCTLLVRFYEILDSQSQFLDPFVRDEIPVLGQKMAQMYATLARRAFDRNVRLWKMHPKLHMWEHLTEEQAIEFGNPRYWWTYADEDLVGLMTEVAVSVHPKTLACNVLYKWLLLHFDE